MNILVVDDDRETLQLIQAFLEDAGHGVRTAENTAGALAEIDREPPRLTLLDIRLPDGDGLDVLKTVKERHPEVAVVMMTGFKDADMIVEAFRRGATDCLFKPFNFEYLKSQILPRVEQAPV